MGAKRSSDSSDGLAIFVSIVPQKQIVERIGGPDVRVAALVGPGQSPHTFTITPGQIRRLSEADLFFAIGVDFELGALPRLRDTCPNLKIIDTQAGIKPRSSDRDHAGAHDPHIWLDPIRLRQIATNVCDALIEQDPAHASDYSARLLVYLAELDALDADIAERLAPYAGRTIVVYHPAFGYFADRYRLTEVAIEADGKSPGSRSLKGVVATARDNGVHTIFHEPGINVSMVAAVANEIDGQSVALDPLAPDLVANLRHMADAIAASFEDQPK